METRAGRKRDLSPVKKITRQLNMVLRPKRANTRQQREDTRAAFSSTDDVYVQCRENVDNEENPIEFQRSDSDHGEQHDSLQREDDITIIQARTYAADIANSSTAQNDGTEVGAQLNKEEQGLENDQTQRQRDINGIMDNILDERRRTPSTQQQTTSHVYPTLRGYDPTIDGEFSGRNMIPPPLTSTGQRLMDMRIQEQQAEYRPEPTITEMAELSIQDIQDIEDIAPIIP